MTKARARERAKAKAAQKSKKPKVVDEQAEKNTRQGHFDPRANSIKGPGTNFNAAGAGTARRGSARSK